VQLLAALALNAVFWSGMRAIVARRTRCEGVDLVLATAVSGFVVILLALEMLGTAGLISTASVAAICVATGVLGVWMSRHPSSTGERSRVGACELRRRSQTRSHEVFALFAIGVAAWLALVYLLLGLTLPVEAISDAPIYHLPFAVAWWKAGTLALVPTPFGDAAATYFPANGDLWLAWLVASGSGALAKVGQWPLMVVGATALYGLARVACFPWPAAVMPGALWIGLPIVVTQSSLANVDLIWAAFYLVAVYFVVRWFVGAGPERQRWLFLCALACGIVIGTKAVGALFVTVLLLIAAAAVARGHQPITQGALLGLGVVLPSAYWYLRNLAVTGNPLYPLNLAAFGFSLAPGWYDAAAMNATAYHLPEAAWRTFIGRLELVSGRVGFALVAAGMVIGWIQSARPSIQLQSRRALALYSTLALLHGVLYWFVVPYNTQERFLLAAFGLALVSLASVAAADPVAHAALCLLLLWQLVARTAAGEWFTVLRVYDNPLALGDMRLTLVMPVSIVAALIVLRCASRARVTLATLIVVAACTVTMRPMMTVLAEQPLLAFYPRTGFAASLFPGWEVVERAASPNGVRVAYAGTNLPYYLFGTGLRNEVQYVNVNDHPDWLPHDYHRARTATGDLRLAHTPFPHWDRDVMDAAAWMANLRRNGIDLLFIARENRHGQLATGTSELPPFPIEREWADAHPEVFVDLGPFEYAPGTIPWVRVYRVRRAR
jgi:hypothetical protein